MQLNPPKYVITHTVDPPYAPLKGPRPLICAISVYSVASSPPNRPTFHRVATLLRAEMRLEQAR